MEKKYYLGFSLFPGIGSVLFGKLLHKFGSAKDAWHAEKEDIQKIVGEKLAEKFVAFRNDTNLEKEMEKCVQLGVQLVTREDKEYPALLRDTGSRVKPGMTRGVPFLLYVKGDVSILSSPKTIGIVGTRKMTPYGKDVTQMLTTDLVHAGFVIVSGLALGVDAMAHSTTVKNNGKTIAVLGCGVDCCYPRENQKVYDEILSSGGAIVSIFPISMTANVGTFPARNTIIAGLSQAIVVTEGAEDSGSLITAECAKKFGRPVFSVPGPITSSLSKGTNSLLKAGGILVVDSNDIMKHLKVDDEWLKQKKKNPASNFYFPLSREERDIIQLLETSPLHFDEIVRKIGKDSKSIGSLLSLMELKGMVKSNGSIYSLN